MDLDRNHDTQTPHLAVRLPEIVANIVPFLPKSDLISCTLINSTWEQEARIPLLVLSQFLIDPQNITHHQEISSVRGNSARNVGVVEFRNLSRGGPCGNFISAHGHKVNRLVTRLPPPDVEWPQFFETLSNSFPNLTSVAFVFNRLDYTDSPPSRTIFSKVKNLAICNYNPSDFEGTQQILSTQLAPLFPNLVALWCQRICPSVVRSFLKFAPTLTILTLINIPLIDPIQENTVNLTRLEIGLDSNPNRFAQSVTAMLKISSGTLENLRLSRVPNIEPFVVQNCIQFIILFPILPRLRVFELVHNDFATRLGDNTNSQVTPAINLQFVRGSAETKLPYAEQFPVLETLRVLKGASSRNDKLTDQDFFEASMGFLYNSFLHSTNTKCLTLKNLVIPFQEECGEKFKFFDIFHIFDSRKSFGGFEWKDTTADVLERVIDVFPNLIQLEKKDKPGSKSKGRGQGFVGKCLASIFGLFRMITSFFPNLTHME
ncbi:uncharacterized protein LOC110850358 [Folsomia candida]|uniref:F-box domain-containing protein n=1 Tax=Folsomia candida TaxID=158441 RepID=A0A226F4X9_FOLCA|nr:uncharacterized protein LOC110850358 [Folsomia candida]XP_021953495.1 uncharacterized protein LOC110850358 [Folsomia candida]XP_035705974.1 uncharacterized protein LOC110850358 [Folsomia candida]XP_035705978.1 uncharacterized protein LOC110850358 [Folsomia candida]OXA64488.1 hypothetical protein Fcan01_00096 [Folsomia candida]